VSDGTVAAAPSRLARPTGLGARFRRASRAFLSRRVRLALLTVVVVLVAWEGGKALFGTPWRVSGAVVWNPPFRIPFFNDLNLPHAWAVLVAFVQPWQRGQDLALWQYLTGAAFFTWREAALGFLIGSSIGIVLAMLFVRSRLLERAFVPYVIASQTIPIIALAPLIISAFGQSIGSVVLISTYLAFFPVTIAMIRGLRSFDPRALELMRSYASSETAVFRKLRLPASQRHLFTALKIAATAAIVGAIIGEAPGGIQYGLGRVIVTFSNYYATGPEKLWCAVVVSGILGLAFYGLVALVELWMLRGRGPSRA
jgi:NitT/TauT family transport system permease protein